MCGQKLVHDLSLSLRQRLKHATSATHLALENRIGPLETQNEYNEYARGMHAFRSGAEAWLTHHPHSTRDWRAHKIADALTHDVNDLALQPLVYAFGGWRGASDSFAMGVHYVLEGSALGARLLCKRVEALGLTRDHGARHLWAQADNPQNFRGYLDLLSASANNLNEGELIAGADAAFAAAAHAMGRAANG